MAIRRSYNKRASPSMSIKITILCGLVFIFVLRGTIWTDNSQKMQDVREVDHQQHMLRRVGFGRKESETGLNFKEEAIQERDLIEEGSGRRKPFEEIESKQEEEEATSGDEGTRASDTENGSQIQEDEAQEAKSRDESSKKSDLENDSLVQEEESRRADSLKKEVEEALARDSDTSRQETEILVNESDSKVEKTHESGIRDKVAEATEVDNGSKLNVTSQAEEDKVTDNSIQGRDVRLDGTETGTEKSDQQTIHGQEEHAGEAKPHELYKLGPEVPDWDEQRRNWSQNHPGMDKSMNVKPRILLISGSQPKPCVNATGDHFHVKSMKNKIDYCRLHGIEFFYNMAFLDKVMTGFWSKLPLLRKLMLSHPEIEWFWWMDSDAIFTDMLFEVPIEKYTDYNMVIPGRNKEVYEDRHWVALNTGSFLIRNCKWSLDFLNAWAPMGPEGAVREEAGKLLTKSLVGRPEFQADDQSALIYLLITQKDKWADKILLESSYVLHGFWLYIVDRYEGLMEKYHPGLGDERWPFVTHFVGCKPCSEYGDYPVEQCLKQMERAFNFADNQVLQMYGFQHLSMETPEVKWIGSQTANWPVENLHHHPSFVCRLHPKNVHVCLLSYCKIVQ